MICNRYFHLRQNNKEVRYLDVEALKAKSSLKLGPVALCRAEGQLSPRAQFLTDLHSHCS